ncbi:MAG: deoxyhypusine synthase [Candidatus Diapherotrites archaeon]|nr:deoxyhypusine synthase [Candidatus Diapherotrites archaeon]
MEPSLDKEKVQKAHDVDYVESGEAEGVKIEGFDFSKPFDFKKFLESYKGTGFQASHLAIAIDIIREMRKEKAVIFLAYNSNMVTSGLRDLIAYLVKNKMVQVLVTTAGGIEEDVMKTTGPFVLGSFGIEGRKLRDKSINRTGNILVANKRYIEFEEFMQPFLEKLYQNQKKTGKIICTSDFIFEMGKEMEDEKSIYHWASKNNIPCFCPAITDGAIGDNIFFFKQKRPDFKIDLSDDMVKIVSLAINAEKSGIIVLGGGFVKHHVCNANLLRDGADYAVYVTTDTEEGGSDSGARPDEAVSWGKIKAEGRMVKVYADATLVFPLIVAGAFAEKA